MYATCPAHFIIRDMIADRLCGLVVRVPSYRSIGQGSIPGATRFSEKWWVHSASWVQLRSYLKGKVAGYGLENREYGHRNLSRWVPETPISTKVGTNFTDKRQSLGRYSSLTDFFFFWNALSLCIFFLMPETKFHSHTKSQARVFVYRLQTGRQKAFELWRPDDVSVGGSDE
jgi:hypothetical protein